MNLILWVAGSMLAAVGLVQVIAWVVCRAQGTQKEKAAYKVVRLEKELAKLADQLRYELLLLHWISPVRPEVLVFVDDGLGNAEKDLCKRMLGDFQTAILCAPEELEGLVKVE